MKKFVLCLAFVLSGANAAQAASLGSACESVLRWSAGAYNFANLTLPLSLGLTSKTGYNLLTLRRDVTWTATKPDQAFSGHVFFEDVGHAYPQSRVIQLKFQASLYTATGKLEQFPAGEILVLDKGLVSRSIHRPIEEEIEKLLVRFVRMQHHQLNGSSFYYDDAGQERPIDTSFLKFVVERYTRLTGRELPITQVHLGVVNGYRDPIVMKLLRKYAQFDHVFAGE